MAAEIAGENQPALGRGDAGKRRRRGTEAPFHLPRIGVGGDHEATPIGILLAEEIAVTAAGPLLPERDAGGLGRIEDDHRRAPVFFPRIVRNGVPDVGGAPLICAPPRLTTI